MSQSKTPELDAEIAQLDRELDSIAEERDALRAKAVGLMERRNRAIAARELHLRENPTPVMGLPDQGRLAVLRAKAGVAQVGTEVTK